MSDLFWLTDKQMWRIEPHFPLSHGIPRVDDKRVLSGILFVIRNGLRGRDAPSDYGPPRSSRPKAIERRGCDAGAGILMKVLTQRRRGA